MTTIQARDSRTGETTNLRVIPGDKTVALQCRPMLSLELDADQAQELAAALVEWAEGIRDAAG